MATTFFTKDGDLLSTEMFGVSGFVSEIRQKCKERVSAAMILKKTLFFSIRYSQQHRSINILSLYKPLPQGNAT